MHQIEECSANEMVPVLFSLLDKIDRIKAELPETFRLKSTFNFRTTKDLEFVDLLQENLKELANSKADSLSSVKATAQAVQQDLLFLRSCLHSIAEQCNQHENLRTFWSRVMEAAYEAEFVIGSFKVGDISSSSLKLFNTVAEEIKLLKTEALEIDDHNYVLVTPKASKTLSNVPLQRTFSAVNEVVVGLKDQETAIIDQLTRGPKQLDVVSIVGMPGLGKTTLAQKVYHDRSILCHFTSLAWCCISQVYNKKDLLIEILACIFPNNSEKYSGMKEDDLAQELYQHLKRKRYLIVLDDVWDIKAWNALEISFPDDANGSRILLTSRHSDVALQIKPTGKLHPLRRLTEAESLELLQKKLAGKEDYYPALPVLGEKIARNCHGLPLTVVVIAGILASLDEAGWEDVAERLSSVVRREENCTSVLELSYGHLPDFLKPCFLYFGTFVEDEEISIQRLILLWIAEGFVEKNGQKSQEEMAEEYTMALISRSLITIAEKSSTGGVKTCRIHDLLHEFSAAKAKEESFVQLVRGYDQLSDFVVPRKLRRLCIDAEPEHFEKPRLFCPRIRSLVFIGPESVNDHDSFNLGFLFCCKLLRVLDLLHIHLGSVFPSEILMLTELRYLAIGGKIDRIPSSIVNLFHLETLMVNTLCSKFFFPDTIWMMQKLRCLRVIGYGFVDLTSATENLVESTIVLHNLDTFSTPELYLGKNMEEVLRKIPNIRKLKCRLLEEPGSKKIVEMGFLSRLQSLSLILDKVLVDQIEFHFPSNLKKLSLQEFSSSMLSGIGKLPGLQVLKLMGLKVYGPERWEMEEGISLTSNT